MAIIEADTKDIEKELHNLEELLCESGGGVHSNLLIRSQDGNLSIETKEPMPPGKEIIRLARGSLLPNDQYNLILKGHEFSVDFPQKSNMSTVQRKMVESMAHLYTLTDKATLQKEYSFSLSIAPYPTLFNKIEEARELPEKLKELQKKLRNALTRQDFDDYLCQSFLKTRLLGYNDPVRISSVSTLMPIVDFMNHHWTGASFNTGQGVRRGDLSIVNSQSNSSKNLQCYAFYGIMDSLDTLLRYDFIDETTPIVRSIPIDIDVPGHGKLSIRSTFGGERGKPPKQVSDLPRFVPHMKRDEETKTLTLSCILIPIESSPLALRRILAYALSQLLGERPMEEHLRMAWLYDAEAQILNKNRIFYTEFLAEIKKLSQEKLSQEKGQSPGLERLQHLAELQLSKLAH